MQTDISVDNTPILNGMMRAVAFYLFADEGGIPPRNKVKVQTADGSLIKLTNSSDWSSFKRR